MTKCNYKIISSQACLNTPAVHHLLDSLDILDPITSDSRPKLNKPKQAPARRKVKLFYFDFTSSTARVTKILNRICGTKGVKYIFPDGSFISIAQKHAGNFGLFNTQQTPLTPSSSEESVSGRDQSGKRTFAGGDTTKRNCA
jgi:hypothetical protein